MNDRPKNSQAQETLDAVVERVTYYNEETSYTVLRVKPNRAMPGITGRDGLATVVGALPPINEGEDVRFTGMWVMHATYGKQFKAERADPILPTTIEGLKRYLASGAIRGIGSRTAQAIVDHFGLKAVDILNSDPLRIREVPGISPTRAQSLIKAWMENFGERQVLIFLQGYGIGARLARKIYETYGDETVIQVRTNPYQLAREVQGIGFKIADRIARSMGMPLDAIERIEAGVVYALETLMNDGHVFAPRPLVIEQVIKLLELPAVAVPSEDYSPPDSDELTYEPLDSVDYDPDQHHLKPNRAIDERIQGAIQELLDRTDVILQHVPDEVNGGTLEALYLRPMLISERNSAKRLHEMVQWKTTRLLKAKTFGWIKFFSLLQSQDRINLTNQQRDAVEAALTNKVSILTGGPGTGKTTTLRAVIRALETLKAKYALASPTGRAAKRLSEATGRPAMTLHRLLGFMPGETYEADTEPLDVDMLIIDESSMLDLVLFYNVLKAVAPDTHLMLVGDVDQLPSVGAGDVLRDLIKGGIAHVTRLDTIFRQADDSLIIVNAHHINKGEMPKLDNMASDFFMFPAETPDSAGDLLVDIVTRRIPEKFGFDPVDEIQVLAPMYRGGVGIQVLNERLQAALNPGEGGRTAEKKIDGRVFRVGDKVMQTRNNYEKDVYNGDIGRLYSLSSGKELLTVSYDGRLVDYYFSEVEELLHAFAVSVHRSQGSEYPVVVMPIMPQHFIMLQRNLLYTAVTRAKKLVVLVGQKKSVWLAVQNDKVAQRYSGLAYRLDGQMR